MRGTTTRRVRSQYPVIRGSAEVSTVRWGNLDEDVVVSFPDFRGQHGPVTLQVTESEPYDFFSLLFPEELWDVLVEQTNIYVAQKQRKSWFNDTNKDEMKAFSGNCGRIFIGLTIQDNLLLLMRALISCTNYGQ